jgi:hypothetical protein
LLAQVNPKSVVLATENILFYPLFEGEGESEAWCDLR